MQKDRGFLRRRLEEAIFHYWLLKKHSEKNPSDSLSSDLAQEYRRKYIRLMEEYISLFSGE